MPKLGLSDISNDEQAQLKQICGKIRGLDFSKLSGKTLEKAYSAISGGVPLGAKKGEEIAQFRIKLNKITSNPPMTRAYLKKLEKAYTVLRS